MNPDAQDAKMESSLFSLLPENVVEEILLRLPAESLVRFKRVQKSWRALMGDQSFAKRHLQASIDNGKTSSSATLLLDFGYREEEPGERSASGQLVSNSKQALRLVSISSQGEGSNGGLCCVVDAPSFPQFVKAKMELEDLGRCAPVSVSHCNGIVCAVHCLATGNGKIVLCNPATKEFECVSPPIFEPGYAFAGHGFGYDSRGDDYKYVKIAWSFGKFSTGVSSRLAINLTYKAHLYTMGTDSWREIKINAEIGSFALCLKGVYSKDVYYWRSMPISGTKAIVLALDMSKEEFHRIPLPNCVRDRILVDSKWWRLALWKESVVLFNVIEDSPHSTLFEMWVMVDKFGGVDGDDSWTKHLTIGPLANVRNALQFWKDDELLLQRLDGGIVSYNLHTTEVRTIPTGLMVYPFSFHVEPYVNSLVSIKRRNVLNR